MIALNVKFVAKPGKRDEIAKVMETAFDITRNEPGTPLYLMLFDKEDENVVWFWMVYSGDEGFKAHTGGEVERIVRPQVESLSESSEVQWLDLVGGLGLRVPIT